MSSTNAARRRHQRARAARGPSVVGRRFEVSVGPAAHGGHWVARLEADAGPLADRVVFVRHAVTGERVVVEITDGTETDRFLRGDAVEVLRASPERVEPPCRLAGPGGCGGCDLQHLSLSAQRSLKAGVIVEQLRRVARIELNAPLTQPGIEPATEPTEDPMTDPSAVPAIAWSGEVEPVPGDHDGLGWRTRMRFHTLPGSGSGGRRGLRKHRSHDLVEVDFCPIQAPEAVVTLEGRSADGIRREQVLGAELSVARDGFWQVHRGAPDALVAAVLSAAQPQRGDRILDLYAGVGLFTVFLADAVGETGAVVGVEVDPRAVEHGRANLMAHPGAELAQASSAAYLGRPEVTEHRWDCVVLDPPSQGAGREAVAGIVATGAARVVYVSCDPATLARDVGWLVEGGYRLSGLRAFDAFPMTHHVECVAHLVKSR